MRHTEENKAYLNTEAWGGAALIIAAIAGFILGNSPLESYYDAFVNFPIKLGVNQFEFNKPLLFWINDGLIAIFFLLIGLEIKSALYYEAVFDKSLLTAPLAAAISGVIFPAAIFALFNYQDPISMRGWAIPTPIDTAFVLGILAIMGSSVSAGIKMFVMSISIIDDIIAVLVIAIFYTHELSNIAIIASMALVGVLWLLNQVGVRRAYIYIIFGIALWLSVLASGIHTSIAGVLLAVTIPMDHYDTSRCLLNKFKHFLHPWAAFFILPLFAFANTGFDLEKVSIQDILEPLSLGIILGLFIGKQLGVFGIVRVLHNYRLIKLPDNTSWLQMYGVSVLCGVGFTLSLFIGLLAFEGRDSTYDAIVKASVFIGSLLSAGCGLAVLQVGRYTAGRA